MDVTSLQSRCWQSQFFLEALEICFLAFYSFRGGLHPRFMDLSLLVQIRWRMPSTQQVLTAGACPRVWVPEPVPTLELLPLSSCMSCMRQDAPRYLDQHALIRVIFLLQNIRHSLKVGQAKTLNKQTLPPNQFATNLRENIELWVSGMNDGV